MLMILPRTPGETMFPYSLLFFPASIETTDTIPVGRVSTVIPPVRSNLYPKTYSIIGEGNNKLNDEITLSSYYCAAGTPVCAFAADAGILLVETNDVGTSGYVSIAGGLGSIEVLGHYQISTMRCWILHGGFG